MAHQFYRSSHQSRESSTPPKSHVDCSRSSFTHSSRSIPAQGVPLLFGDNNGANTNDDRSSKRQRGAETSHAHKFVSQKKWKFSEGQPWLPSRVSPKAQNATKGCSPNRKDAVVTQSGESSNSIPNESLDDRTNNIRKADGNQTDLYRSKQHTQMDSAQCEKVAGIRQTAKQPVASSSDQKTSRSADLTKNSGQQQPGSQRNPSMFLQSSQPSQQPSRGAVNGNTLSLTKDAERIALLIAAKKKENESSMFRERLLRRQIRHQSRRNSQQQDPQVTDFSINDSDGSLADDDDDQEEEEEEEESDSLVEVLSVNGHETKAYPEVYRTNRHLTSVLASVEQPSTLGTYENSQVHDRPISYSSTEVRLPKTTPLNTDFPNAEKYRHKSVEPETTHYQGPGSSYQTRNNSSMEHKYLLKSQHYTRSDGIPYQMNMERSRRADSVLSTTEVSSVDLSTAAPSPASAISAQSVLTVANRRPSYTDRIPHATYSTSASVAANSVAYSTIWNMSRQNSYQSESGSGTVNNRSAASVSSDQMSQSQSRKSSISTHSCKSRSSNSRKDSIVVPPKRRVNMFGDFQGTALPMHEVIRSIEMT